MERHFTARLALCSSFCVASLTLSPPASGSVQVEGNSQGNGTVFFKAVYDPTRVQTDILRGKKKEQSIYFDGRKLVFVDHNKKTFFEMTKADTKRLGDIMKQAQAMMKNLPPETRKMLEKRIGSIPNSNTPIRYKKAGQSKKNRWTCQMYETFQGKKKIGALCAAAYSSLGVNPNNFRVVDKMIAFMGSLGSLSKMIAVPSKKDFDGFPIWSKIKVGSQTFTSTMTSVKSSTTRPDAFKRPAGYQMKRPPTPGR